MSLKRFIFTQMFTLVFYLLFCSSFFSTFTHSQSIPPSYILHHSESISPELRHQIVRSSLSPSSSQLLAQQHTSSYESDFSTKVSDSQETIPFSTANPCWVKDPGPLCSQPLFQNISAYLTYTPIVPLLLNVTRPDSLGSDQYSTHYTPASGYFFAGDIAPPAPQLSDNSTSTDDDSQTPPPASGYIVIDIDWSNSPYIDMLFEPVFLDQLSPHAPLRALCNATDFIHNRTQYVFNQSSTDSDQHAIIMQLYGYWGYNDLSSYLSTFNTTLNIAFLNESDNDTIVYIDNGDVKHINALCYDPSASSSTRSFINDPVPEYVWNISLVNPHRLYDPIGVSATIEAAPVFANIDSQLLTISWFFRGYIQWNSPSTVSYAIHLVGPLHFVPNPKTIINPDDNFNSQLNCQLNGLDIQLTLSSDYRSITFSIVKDTSTFDFVTSSFSDGAFLGLVCYSHLIHVQLPSDQPVTGFLAIIESLQNGNQETQRSYTLPFQPTFLPPADLVYAGSAYITIPSDETVPLWLRSNNYYALPSQTPPQVSEAEVHVTEGLLSCSWSVSYREFIQGWYTTFAWVLFNGVTWSIDTQIDPQSIPILLHIRPTEASVYATTSDTITNSSSSNSEWSYEDTRSAVISVSAISFEGRADGEANQTAKIVDNIISTSWPFEDVFGPIQNTKNDLGLYDQNVSSTKIDIIAVLPYEKYGGHLTGEALQCSLAILKSFSFQEPYYYSGCATSATNCTNINSTSSTSIDNNNNNNNNTQQKQKNQQNQQQQQQRSLNIPPIRHMPLNTDTIRLFSQSSNHTSKSSVSEQFEEEQQPEVSTSLQSIQGPALAADFSTYNASLNPLSDRRNLFTFSRNRNLISAQSFSFRDANWKKSSSHLDVDIFIADYPTAYLIKANSTDTRALFPSPITSLNFSFPLRYFEFNDQHDPNTIYRTIYDHETDTSRIIDTRCTITGTAAVPFDSTTNTTLGSWLIDPLYNTACPKQKLTSLITWDNLIIDNGDVMFTNITFPELTIECPLRISCPSIHYVAVSTLMYQCNEEHGCYHAAFDQFQQQAKLPLMNETCFLPTPFSNQTDITYPSNQCDWESEMKQTTILKTQNNNFFQTQNAMNSFTNQQYSSLSSSSSSLLDDGEQHLVLGNSAVNALLGLNSSVALMSLSATLSLSPYIYRVVALVRPKAVNIPYIPYNWEWVIVTLVFSLIAIVVITLCVLFWVCWARQKCTMWWATRYSLRLNDTTVDSYFPRGYFVEDE